jgi:hypothetical protein
MLTEHPVPAPISAPRLLRLAPLIYQVVSPAPVLEISLADNARAQLAQRTALPAQPNQSRALLQLLRHIAAAADRYFAKNKFTLALR